MRIYSTIFALLFLIASCKNKEVVIPDTILPQEKMIEVMVDLQLVNALSQKRFTKDPKSPGTTLADYSQVFDKHEMTRESFQESLNFYKEHPPLLIEIYDQMLNEFSKRQAGLKKESVPD